MSKKRTTTASRRIGRKIQTQRFESLEVSIEVQDEIEWDTMEERQVKLTKLTNLSLMDFEDCFNTVCNSLGLDERANVTRTLEDGREVTGSVSKSPTNSEKPKDTDSMIDDMESMFDEMGH